MSLKGCTHADTIPHVFWGDVALSQQAGGGLRNLHIIFRVIPCGPVACVDTCWVFYPSATRAGKPAWGKI